MDNEQKRRAAAYVRHLMSERGWDDSRLVVESGLDPATVRKFLSAERWPQTPTRTALEQTFGIGLGTLAMVAHGFIRDEPAEQEDEGDEVERAIRRSELTRANQHKLIGTYYGMLDEQRGVRGA